MSDVLPAYCVAKVSNICDIGSSGSYSRHEGSNSLLYANQLLAIGIKLRLL